MKRVTKNEASVISHLRQQKAVLEVFSRWRWYYHTLDNPLFLFYRDFLCKKDVYFMLVACKKHSYLPEGPGGIALVGYPEFD